MRLLPTDPAGVVRTTRGIPRDMRHWEQMHDYCMRAAFANNKYNAYKSRTIIGLKISYGN